MGGPLSTLIGNGLFGEGLYFLLLKVYVQWLGCPHLEAAAGNLSESADLRNVCAPRQSLYILMFLLFVLVLSVWICLIQITDRGRECGCAIDTKQDASAAIFILLVCLLFVQFFVF